MELKIIVVTLMTLLIIYNFFTYKPVDSDIFGYGAPSKKSVILFLITFILFVFGLYLNDFPIYI